MAYGKTKSGRASQSQALGGQSMGCKSHGGLKSMGVGGGGDCASYYQKKKKAKDGAT